MLHTQFTEINNSFFYMYSRGLDKNNEEAFRQDYGRIGELRSLLHRNVPFIALTATATKSVRKVIINDLCLHNCATILGNPNKPNIRYAVVEIDSDDLEQTFDSIIEDIDTSGIDASKVLIFCRKKDHVKQLYETFSNRLGDKAYYRPTGQEPKDDRTRLFAMYHKKTHKLVKETVETEFCKEKGSVRVLFCTIAFGMGVDVKGAHLAIHVGPSSDLDDYLQESGRIGRSTATMSHALLLKFKGCTKSKNISKAMKDYIRNSTECRRVSLLKPFCSSPQPNNIKHSCCDVCAKSCRCGCACGLQDCVCAEPCPTHTYQSSIEMELLNAKVENKKKATKPENVINNVSSKMKCHLRNQLMAYRSQLASNVSHEQLLTGLDLTTGYSRKLILDIVKNVQYIASLQSIQQKFTFFNDSHAINTWQIICGVLELSDAELESDRELLSSNSGSDNNDEDNNDSESDDNNGDDNSDSKYCDYNSEDSDIGTTTTRKLRIVNSSDDDSCSSDDLD